MMSKTQGKYFSVLLAANAVLLTLFLVVQMVEHPIGVQEAQAEQAQDKQRQKYFTNDNELRVEMIKQLKEVREAVEANSALLRSGTARVRVTNLDEIKIPESRGSGG